MSRLPIHVCAVQFATDAPQKAINMDNGLHWLDAAAEKADLVLLPETAFSGYWLGGKMVEFAEPIPGPITKIVSEIAVKRNSTICFGMTELDGEKMYNTAVLIGADGKILGKHRKVHLYEADIESGFSAGDRLEVFDTHLGRIGILVCYDAFYIESICVLDLKGAEIVLIPSVGLSKPDDIERTMWSWEIVLCANAKFGRCHIVWANKVGMDNDLVCIGNSMIISPEGDIVARGGASEEIVQASIPLQPKAPRSGRRPEVYGLICRGRN